ncbi:MAG: type II secretion system protein GspG [Verrucomicrobia bacterium RIFCSPHIGHO2_12_FULL_41_10]|nr:MAG: type II secretion system protein GspG [Verrucomicrobia bacterium RIFCSPHIGHO2_12_FULL_41_10]HLB33546.1 type II secretion system major pseudopilin GspG [Chthoniobacterales bacterium]
MTPYLFSQQLRQRRHFREAGYTLFEIMLVLGIISVLVGSAIYMLSGNIDVAKEQRVTSDIQAISMQLRTYEMLNYRKPTTEQGLLALVQPPSADPKPPRWKKLMEAVPLDPWGNEYIYRNPGKYKPDSYDLYSLGAQGKEGEGNIGR